MNAWTKRFALTLLLALAALPAAAAGHEGYLYGKITTRDGTSYQGRLRWDDEEAFWGDFFNSSKEANPWPEKAPRRERERKRTIEVFGFELGSIGGDWHHDTRQFTARFGDIARIEPRGSDDVLVTLKSGTKFDLEGGSNDVEAKVQVWDGNLGTVAIEWKRIRSIELLPTPAQLASAPLRLHGKVTTRDGEFIGFVQWDQEECLGSDELDGETADGDTSVRMETIRAIERRSRSSSEISLANGRKLVLSDTNDVDSSNRGIYVDDPRYGRVLVSWDAFERVDFAPAGSGPAYSAYAPGERLAGTVTTSDGRKITGRLVYDLDESETTETLDAPSQGVDYTIPFGLITSIVPIEPDARGAHRPMVSLRGGEELQLERSGDVGPRHGGVLVFTPGRERPEYLRWQAVHRLDFAPPPATHPPLP
jgi:hypothetical protein